MNYSKFVIAILFLFSINTVVLGQMEKTSFEVSGNCNMCKERIETALDVKGVKFANWNAETQTCKVSFNPTKVSKKEIHQIIAKVGHDTQICRAPDEAYKGLHQCCQYRRAEVSK
jgi:copper chaperone CopZ